MSASAAILWNLDVTVKEVVKESVSWDPGSSLVGELEAILGHDLRERVAKSHFAPGGKYRSVLKIHATYENDKRWWSGTGWLIKDDLMVTAGHLAIKSKFNRAVSLNTYAGYHGLGSVRKCDVQTRRGKRIVVPEAYYNDPDHYIHDVALVKLEAPFESVRPFTHCDTPEQGSSLLGVVGYPGDKGDVGDPGAFMYEQFAYTTWDLSKSHLHLLQYPISTYPGQSGAPVICGEKSQCIGTHIQSFGGASFNSASSIGGKYGNSYSALVGAIEEEPLHISNGLWMASLPLSEKGPPEKQIQNGPQRTSKSSAQPLFSPPDPTTQSHRKEQVFGTLQRYHTLFLVDESDSMMVDDFVTGSPWEKTKKAIEKMATIAVKYDSDGVEVKFFNSYFEPHKRKNLKSAKEVMSLFQDLKPCGDSLIADLLDEVLNDYCYEFEKNRDIKGLNLIVLTDGDPSDDQDVEAKVVKFARALERLKAHSLKVGIQFVLMGNDSKAKDYFARLDDNLESAYKLDRDMVDTVPWVEGDSEPLHEKILLGGILKRYDSRFEH